uniref:Uncharacterized protein n=1 Tax=Sphaerodactylus townsendi TaxID=933632 RepID=A0ACB8G6P1_9SAUR
MVGPEVLTGEMQNMSQPVSWVAVEAPHHAVELITRMEGPREQLFHITKYDITIGTLFSSLSREVYVYQIDLLLHQFRSQKGAY